MTDAATKSGSHMASDQRVRFWGARWFFHFYLVILLAYVGMSLWLLIGGASERHGTAPLITGIFMTVIAVPAAVIMARVCVIPMVVEDAVLKIPRPFGTKTVPLAEISGVGLIWRRQYRNTGWGLQIWDGEGKGVRILRFMATLEVNADDHSIATSAAGQVATRLYEAVLANQGSGGRLSTQAMQKTVQYERNRQVATLAWWSPDGSRGQAKGTPPTDPTTVVHPSADRT